MVGGEWGDASRELNIGFFSRMKRGRPWVRMKIAASLDGRTALAGGASQWITGEAARADGHAWRKRAGAVLTGIGTVQSDDPRLDVRLVPSVLQPLRVVVDSRLEIAASARVLQPPGRALIYTASDDAARIAALASAQVEVARLPANAQGKTDLVAMLADLARREVNELHVEAGEKLNGSLLREGLVDELLLYVAPRLLGAGRGIAGWSISRPPHRALCPLATKGAGCSAARCVISSAWRRRMSVRRRSSRVVMSPGLSSLSSCKRRPRRITRSSARIIRTMPKLWGSQT